MENFHFGKNLRRIREEKEIKQEVMGTDLGMSQGSLSKIELESSVPNDKFVRQAAEYLDVPRQDLLPPSWFTEIVKRKVYALSGVGHGFYIFFIAGFALEGMLDIYLWQERTLTEKVLIGAVFLLAAFALYRFTVRRVEITEHL